MQELPLQRLFVLINRQLIRGQIKLQQVRKENHTFNKFTQVLEVGSRAVSKPASRRANFGFSSLKPLRTQM